MDKKLLSLFFLFFLVFATFTASVIFEEPLTQFTRAKEELTPSATNSLLLAWPLKIPADGKTTATINVFVRSNTDRPITNKTVSIVTTLGELKNTTAVTDGKGKAEFLIASPISGTADIEAIVDNSVKLSQKISVKFE